MPPACHVITNTAAPPATHTPASWLMSIIQPDSIKAIAHSVDITRLSDDAARTLAPDVEYRLREVVQVRT